MPLKTQIFCFLILPVLERPEVIVWDQKICKNVFRYENFGYIPAYLKKAWAKFFFRYSIQMFSFSSVPIFDRSDITVWEKEIFKNIFCYENFQLQQKRFCFIWPQSTWIFLILLLPILKRCSSSWFYNYRFSRKKECL